MELDNGIFTVELSFPSFNDVVEGLPDGENLLITISDISDPDNPIVFSSQSVLAAPLAFRSHSSARAESALSIVDEQRATPVKRSFRPTKVSWTTLTA